MNRHPGHPATPLPEMSLDEVETARCDTREDAESRSHRGWEDQRDWPVWSLSTVEQRPMWRGAA